MAALSFGQGPIKYPNSDDIDPDTARILFQNCPILIIENLPIGTEFGIDMNVFRVGKKFQGIKMIPPGVHYIYWSPVEKGSGQPAPRSSLFYNFKPQEIVVKRWLASEEDFDDDFLVDETQLGRYKDNLWNLNNYLGAYQYSTYAKYIGLTDHINEMVVNRLTPKNRRIRSVAQLIPSNNVRTEQPVAGPSSASTSSNPEVRKLRGCDHDLPKMDIEPESAIRYSVVPQGRPDANVCSDPSQVTQYNLDSSSKLEHVLDNYCNRDFTQLLGELQFAFLTFLNGQVYDSFEHWKELVKLICSSDIAIKKYPQLYSDLIRILHFEIKEVPEDLFVDIVDSNNFLLSCLSNLFSNLEHSPFADDQLKKRSLQFKKSLVSKFGWDFDLEPDDELPVVVDMCIMNG